MSQLASTSTAGRANLALAAMTAVASLLLASCGATSGATAGRKSLPGDRDGDGVPDDSDSCPSEPEDADGFQDDDGCPEQDNDSDGVADAFDRCPMAPHDGTRGDGCPGYLPVDPDGVLPADPARVLPVEVPDGFSVRLERRVCDGLCPAYAVEVASDGTVAFDGRELARVVGGAQGRISEDAVGQLAAAVWRVGFFGLLPSYVPGTEACLTYTSQGAPVHLTVRVRGQQHDVELYDGCRGGDAGFARATELAAFLDRLVDVEQWLYPVTPRAASRETPDAWKAWAVEERWKDCIRQVSEGCRLDAACRSEGRAACEAGRADALSYDDLDRIDIREATVERCLRGLDAACPDPRDTPCRELTWQTCMKRARLELLVAP